MVRITNREHTECVSGGFEPNFKKAGRGAIVRREAESAATEKLKGESQNTFEGDMCTARHIRDCVRSPPSEKEVGLD